jgi:putative membrane protein
MKNNSDSFFLVFLKGMAMGIADLIPGISGGTIAFIVGIYDRLMFAIHQLFSKKSKIFIGAFLTFDTKKIKKAIKEFDILFLGILFIGLFFSLFVFSNIILFLYSNYQSFLLSFFLGLIVASLFILKEELPKKRSLLFYLLFIISLSFGYVLSTFHSISISNPSLVYIMFSGFIAVSALFLPGISGSYLLLLLGVYDVILQAVVLRDLVILGSFIVGALLGVYVISKIISYALRYFRAMSFTFLFGLVIGSLFLFVNVISITLFSILFFILGFVLVYFLDNFQKLEQVSIKKKKV